MSVFQRIKKDTQKNIFLIFLLGFVVILVVLVQKNTRNIPHESLIADTFVDSDKDGLLDFEEINGCEAYKKEGSLQCSTITFPPTDPMNTDTDSDGFWDSGEVRGCDIYQREDGVYDCGSLTYPATDPTQSDTDGDGALDYSEIMGCVTWKDARGWTQCDPEKTFTPTDPNDSADAPFVDIRN